MCKQETKTHARCNHKTHERIRCAAYLSKPRQRCKSHPHTTFEYSWCPKCRGETTKSTKTTNIDITANLPPSPSTISASKISVSRTTIDSPPCQQSFNGMTDTLPASAASSHKEMRGVFDIFKSGTRKVKNATKRISGESLKTASSLSPVAYQSSIVESRISAQSDIRQSHELKGKQAQLELEESRIFKQSDRLIRQSHESRDDQPRRPGFTESNYDDYDTSSYNRNRGSEDIYPPQRNSGSRTADELADEYRSLIGYHPYEVKLAQERARKHQDAERQVRKQAEGKAKSESLTKRENGHCEKLAREQVEEAEKETRARNALRTWKIKELEVVERERARESYEFGGKRDTTMTTFGELMAQANEAPKNERMKIFDDGLRGGMGQRGPDSVTAFVREQNSVEEPQGSGLRGMALPSRSLTNPNVSSVRSSVPNSTLGKIEEASPAREQRPILGLLLSITRTGHEAPPAQLPVRVQTKLVSHTTQPIVDPDTAFRLAQEKLARIHADGLRVSQESAKSASRQSPRVSGDRSRVSGDHSRDEQLSKSPQKPQLKTARMVNGKWFIEDEEGKKTPLVGNPPVMDSPWAVGDITRTAPKPVPAPSPTPPMDPFKEAEMLLNGQERKGRVPTESLMRADARVKGVLAGGDRWVMGRGFVRREDEDEDVS